jgi:hypothetical protein
LTFYLVEWSVVVALDDPVLVGLRLAMANNENSNSRHLKIMNEKIPRDPLSWRSPRKSARAAGCGRAKNLAWRRRNKRGG